jgi:hypothetical protein
MLTGEASVVLPAPPSLEEEEEMVVGVGVVDVAPLVDASPELAVVVLDPVVLPPSPVVLDGSARP